MAQVLAPPLLHPLSAHYIYRTACSEFIMAGGGVGRSPPRRIKIQPRVWRAAHSFCRRRWGVFARPLLFGRKKLSDFREANYRRPGCWLTTRESRGITMRAAAGRQDARGEVFTVKEVKRRERRVLLAAMNDLFVWKLYARSVVISNNNYRSVKMWMEY